MRTIRILLVACITFIVLDNIIWFNKSQPQAKVIYITQVGKDLNRIEFKDTAEYMGYMFKLYDSITLKNYWNGYKRAKDSCNNAYFLITKNYGKDTLYYKPVWKKH